MIKALRAMLAAGASAEMIVLAVEAAYNSEEQRKARQAEYMREYRKGVRLRNITPPSPSSPTPPITPTPDLANAKSIKSAKSALAECLFLEFWEVYPRRVGRGAARKAFVNALKRAKPEEIMAGAKRYAASCPDPQFTKHPSTWLNADCWLDEPAKLPKTNVVGFRKELAPEPPRPPRTPEEQARIDAQLAKLKRMP